MATLLAVESGPRGAACLVRARLRLDSAVTGQPAAGATGARGALLEGKVCVVSGVGPGLGRRAAVALAAHGADVVLAARRQSTLDEVAAEVEALGCGPWPWPPTSSIPSSASG